MYEIGQRIREARELRGISVIELADAVGVSRGTLYHWEKNEVKKIPLDTVAAFSERLHVSVAWLMGASEDMTPEKAPNPGHVLLEGQAAELFNCYRQLDPERAAKLVGYAQDLVAWQQAEQKCSKNE